MCLDLLYSRRSIRQYTGEPVAQETIIELLKAAMAAPSAGNQQPWHFMVIREKKLLSAIAAGHPYAKMTAQAPLAFLICADTTALAHSDYWPQDCSAATENLLLAVHAKGLGGVWIGVYPRKEREAVIRQLVALPENIVPFSLVPVGHPAESKEPAQRFDPSRVHYERW